MKHAEHIVPLYKVSEAGSFLQAPEPKFDNRRALVLALGRWSAASNGRQKIQMAGADVPSNDAVAPFAKAYATVGQR